MMVCHDTHGGGWLQVYGRRVSFLDGHNADVHVNTRVEQIGATWPFVWNTSSAELNLHFTDTSLSQVVMSPSNNFRYVAVSEYYETWPLCEQDWWGENHHIWATAEIHHFWHHQLTFWMIAYCMAGYPGICTPAGMEGAHFWKYFSNQRCLIFSNTVPQLVNKHLWKCIFSRHMLILVAALSRRDTIFWLEIYKGWTEPPQKLTRPVLPWHILPAVWHNLFHNISQQPAANELEHKIDWLLRLLGQIALRSCPPKPNLIWLDLTPFRIWSLALPPPSNTPPFSSLFGDFHDFILSQKKSVYMFGPGIKLAVVIHLFDMTWKLSFQVLSNRFTLNNPISGSPESNWLLYTR